MSRLARSALVRPAIVVLAVVAGTIALSCVGDLTLFLPAPPVMPRNARYLAILLVPGLALAILGASAMAIHRYPANWPLWAKAVGLAFLIGGGAVLSFLPSVAFFLLHFACYEANVCAVNLLPRETMYTITVATRDTPLESLLAWALVVGLAMLSRDAKRELRVG